ncbi:putative short chain type dehydrogenase [Microthyrium microscopicum]|uniref:Putative short chain type dehydrogenase n=1 Tax=Microthyrium microscopicum TaxID=703497 RepID=A0A6A6TYW2_9PEZI|nr:putative short chain type dehydrogenase [Microthyrium microscopicum]
MKPADRTFVISGACSGLGLATVRDLHSEGAYIALLDLNEDAGAEIVKELGDRVKFFECDVSETSSVTKAVHGAAEWIKTTGKPMGGVVAAAGVGGAQKIVDGRTGEPIPIEAIDFILNINIRGTLDLVRLCMAHLVKVTPTSPDGERGVLILVASSAAFDGQPGQVAYAASKGAIASLTLPLARDVARYGVRVVTIAPSLFESRMTAVLPEKARKSLERVMEFPVRAGKPEEFASLVRQGVENLMLNGTVLRLDGAMRMPSKM